MIQVPVEDPAFWNQHPTIKNALHVICVHFHSNPPWCTLSVKKVITSRNSPTVVVGIFLPQSFRIRTIFVFSPTSHFPHVCVAGFVSLTALSHTHSLPFFNLFSPPASLYFNLQSSPPFSVNVHITDDVGWLSSQSWVRIYLRLLGRERQHHPEQMSLEIHFGRTRNKVFSFSLSLPFPLLS